MLTFKGKFGSNIIYLSRLHSDYTTKIDTKVLKQTQHFEIKYRIDSQLIKLFVFYVNH